MTAQTRTPLRPVPARQTVPRQPEVLSRGRRVIDGAGETRKFLGQTLTENGTVAPDDLARALAMQSRKDIRLGDILLCNNMVSEQDLLSALSEQWRTGIIDLQDTPPDARLVDSVGAVECLNNGLIPWRRIGSTVIVATSTPEKFENHRQHLEGLLGSVTMALTTETALHKAITRLRSAELAERAEARVALAMSCRGWNAKAWSRHVLVAFLALALLAFSFPVAIFAALTIWAVITLGATLAIRSAALVLAFRDARRAKSNEVQADSAPGPTIARLPVVSVMIPLFKEETTTDKLVERLSRLSYPHELLDILLVIEEGDDTTHKTLSSAKLPRWIRIAKVPAGGVQTKPRALNYALDFCRGPIVGVWDAEDAPDPDQLHRVVRRFHERGPEVACLQGILDYYNARTNWLSRCFTIEYASWFGVVLPGLQKMGLPLPLGGTTLFFRRAVLEKIGGWDAHNVTEDADLGMRLSRLGYRTEMVETVTMEEANCRVVPWIKQRSRWLKGYAMTWAVHSRTPRMLLRDLGAWRFAGFQVLFLGTLSQFFLAPVLWSFWLLAFGLPHPLTSTMPAAIHWPLIGLFVLSELVNLCIGAFSVRDDRRRFLIPWVVTLHGYFPLAALASYKAIYEILANPFFWDKTHHGFHGEDKTDEQEQLAE